MRDLPELGKPGIGTVPNFWNFKHDFWLRLSSTALAKSTSVLDFAVLSEADLLNRRLFVARNKWRNAFCDVERSVGGGLSACGAAPNQNDDDGQHHPD